MPTIDFIEGNSAEDLRAWTDKQPAEWLQGIKVVATDLTNSTVPVCHRRSITRRESQIHST